MTDWYYSSRAPISLVTAASFGKMPTTLATALDLAVETLEWIGAVQLGPMLIRKVHVGQHIHLGIVHERRQSGHAGRLLMLQMIFILI